MKTAGRRLAWAAFAVAIALFYVAIWVSDALETDQRFVASGLVAVAVFMIVGVASLP